MPTFPVDAELLGLLVLAAVSIGMCVFITREILIASVPELRRRNRRSPWL